MSRLWLAVATAATLIASAAPAQPIDPVRVAEEEAILAESDIVLPCRFRRFYLSAMLPGELRRHEIRLRYGMLTHERRRRDASVSMTIGSALGSSDASHLAADRAIFDGLLGPLTLVHDYAGAPGPAGAVGRVYRFESQGRRAMVGTILWRRGDWRIAITAWAYGTRYEGVWADIEQLVREIATSREPRGRARRCPDWSDARPVLTLPD